MHFEKTASLQNFFYNKAVKRALSNFKLQEKRVENLAFVENKFYVETYSA